MRSLLVLIAFALSACSGPSSVRTSHVDLDHEDGLGGTGIDSQELRTICQRMARDLLNCSALFAAGTPRVLMLEPENRTSHFIDPTVFFNIRAHLLEFAGSRIRFVAREDLDAVVAEGTAKRSGQIGYSELKTLAGADFLLTGTIAGIAKQNVGGRSDYYACRFRIVDMESGDLLWEHLYEFKKAGQVGAVYR